MAFGVALMTTAIRSRNWTPRATASNAGDGGTGRATRHERTFLGRPSETHEPCRVSAVT